MAKTNNENSSFPQVFASPTDWNERLISLLSSVAFRRSHLPAFAHAASERLPSSLEVQRPRAWQRKNTRTTTTPILLIVVSFGSSRSYGMVEFFLETARESPSFVVFSFSFEGTEGDSERRIENVADLCVSCTLPTFLIIYNPANSVGRLWEKLNATLNQWQGVSKKEISLRGIISILHEQSQPFHEYKSIAPFGPPDFIPHLKIQISPVLSGPLLQPSLQNPLVIHMSVPFLFSNTGPLWLARVMLKYMLAVTQLQAWGEEYSGLNEFRQTMPKSRL